jgi:hypothetical protein
MVILTLDFKKTFDKLEHEAITDILCQKGFGPRRMKWTTMIMNSRTSEVLLNGVPGKHFHCKHGVRQGDPLSSSLSWQLAFYKLLSTKQRILVFFGSLFRLVADKIFPLYNMQHDHGDGSLPQVAILSKGDVKLLCTINWTSCQLS